MNQSLIPSAILYSRLLQELGCEPELLTEGIYVTGLVTIIKILNEAGAEKALEYLKLNKKLVQQASFQDPINFEANN